MNPVLTDLSLDVAIRRILQNWTLVGAICRGEDNWQPVSLLVTFQISL